ncbi:MAG: IS1634 family transposase [Cryomorphaceae bacterium]|nr:IS1634 family transposase [Cryomorphaceae bacterium]
MFIREVKKQRNKSSNVFYQYSLVQTSRIQGKVKQKVIIYLGSDPELRDKTARQLVLNSLKSLIFKQPQLFPTDIPDKLKKLAHSYYDKYLLRYDLEDVENTDKQADSVSIPPLPQKADYHNVDISGLDISDVKSFGAEHLCKQVLEKLELSNFLIDLGMSEDQVQKSLIAIAGRAIFSSSEHKTAQILDMNSELQGCFGYTPTITHKQLYHIGDLLYKNKDQIDKFLYQRTSDMFDIKDKLVIFDISNTYFETGKKNSKLAKYGRSKEKRNDCPLVVFTGVINAEGFIRHSKIYEGNRADSTTLGDMLADLEQNSSYTSKKTIVIDAGIVNDDNMALIKSKGYDYVCVSHKRLKDYPEDLNPVIQKTDRNKQQVALSIFKPEGETDTWMYVQSDMKRKKEQSISRKLSQRFEEELHSIRDAFAKKGGTKKIEKVWERIGRAKQKHKIVSGRYDIQVQEVNGKAVALEYKIKANPVKEDKEKGVYFIRTSYQDPCEKELWEIYNTIREVESTFRCLKTDLQMRPVYHQRDERIEAHLYLTILAYQLVNTIRYMLKQEGIKHDWKNVLRIMATQTIQTVELPTDKKTIHLRKPSKPIKEVNEIYRATGCTNTQKPIRKYVVYH